MILFFSGFGALTVVFAKLDETYLVFIVLIDSDDDVICLDGDELELNQMPLFQKMLTKIKKEKLEESTQDITASSQPRSPPPGSMTFFNQWTGYI